MGAWSERVEEVIQKLTERGCDPRMNGNSGTARCPAHDDTSPSLSIGIGRDGQDLLQCHAGCSYEQIREALGLSSGPNGAASNGKGSGWKSLDDFADRIKAQDGFQSYQPHYYKDRDGKTLFAVVRFIQPSGEKTFRTFQPDPITRRWRKGIPPDFKQGNRPLYRLPEWANEPTVYLHEGEKCVDLSFRIGLPATSASFGAEHPDQSDFGPLAGKYVVIVPDNDTKGEHYKDTCLWLLRDLAPRPTVKIVRLPVDGKGDDLDDWCKSLVAQGWTKEQAKADLERRAAEAELVDLNTIEPPKKEAVEPSKKKTGRSGKASPKQSGQPGDTRPEIELTTERHLVVDEAITALPADPRLYCRSDALVEVVTEDATSIRLTGKTEMEGVYGQPKVLTLSEACVGCAITRNTKFYLIRKDKKTGEEYPVPAHPPAWLIKAVATKGHWPGIRPLLMVAECPYPRPDGSIVEEPGYDATTKTLYAPSTQFPSLPDRPTQGDAQAAWKRLQEPISQFPFASDDDRAVWLAGLLTVISRPSIDGPVPGVAFIANRAGTGKGLLIDTIGIIAHGRRVPTSRYTSDKEESDKMLGSLALGGNSIVHFDNLDEGSTYGNSALDRGLTSASLNDRVLGSLRTTGDVQLRISWFLSGNNVSPGKDAYRRWLVSNLVTEEEVPEQRQDLEIRNLRAYVTQCRGTLVRDALTILKAHALARRPNGGWAPLGSFELWDEIVRGAVYFATDRDCYKTCKDAAQSSEERLQKLALLEAWQSLPEGRGDGLGITAARVFDLATNPAQLEQYRSVRDVLMMFGHNGKPADPRILGNRIRAMKGAIFNGMRFVEAGKEHGVIRWKVQRATTNGNHTLPA